MPKRVCVIDLPGLSRELMSYIPADSSLGRWAARQRIAGLTPTWPAVTCSVQASLTTGTPPSKHGIISNGVATYRSPEDQALVDASNFADYRKQVSFWEQSNQFVQTPRFWQDANGKSKYKTAMLFFQHSMPGFAGEAKAAADIVLTPKPDHGPDGKLVSLCWSEPRELVGELFKELGPFPLLNYWGPMANIKSSQWIAKAAAKVWTNHTPQLQLVYIPHLDYDLQRFGPASPQAIQAVKDVSAALDPLIDAVTSDGGTIVLLSEYAIRAVTASLAPNRVLREGGFLKTRQTPDGPLVDYESSDAFAMVDHEIAHVYVRQPEKVREIKDFLLRNNFSVEAGPQLRHLDLNHRRSGDLFIFGKEGEWLDYRWWTEPADAPVFARMVDIHRKPGYDPLELFFDPVAKAITQDAPLVRGSHGVPKKNEAVLVTDAGAIPRDSQSATDVAGIIQKLMGL